MHVNRADTAGAEPGPSDLRPADGSLPAASPAPVSEDPLHAELRAIRREITVLAVREQERAAFREAVIDRLHAENQALRQRDVDMMLEPVRRGLYRLYDLAGREAVRWSGQAAPPPEHAGPLLTMFAEEICEVLARTGVEPFTPALGEPYDPARHRPLDTADVLDEALHGTVVRVLTDGFARGDKIARRADVVIGKLRTDQQTRPRSGG